MKNNPFKNPAVKSMLSCAFYLVIIILIWVAISSIVYPNAGDTSTDYASIVEENEPLITQLAEYASDSEILEALQTTDEVEELLESLNITDIQPSDEGAEFTVEDDAIDADVRILYYAEGSYVFSPENPDEWSSSDTETGALRWESTTGYYVAVTRLTENFYLEESGTIDAEE